ncbi:maleylpyruvate isomerase family mycothiol-dependent enzyme [Intrasporangium sp. YIM S08009]|uniref:maleylpyruvate isomerase family mycothiol-dependent enzyme n=1 Tax=Intrasporangium zincisolvens TaxID=3080018 RepID=UPI002B05FFB6|nr:maleylpyruvate isomerase family mycothiol-dependent enzyme [Intrasporangium sp. YIM S08009]
MSSALLSARDLVAAGTALLQRALATLDDAALAEPTALAGWTRAHVVAHVAANAEALVNLTTWARTGVETPMYASPEQRESDIEKGALLAPARLRDWFSTSAAGLDDALGLLDGESWTRLVRTAQGRTVPATEVPWMRTREVMVHAVDLDGGVGFDDLPTDFLLEVLHDAAAKRSRGADGPAVVLVSTDPTDTLDGTPRSTAWPVVGLGDAVTVRGPLPQLAAYVTGRRATGLTAETGTLPVLPHWL